MGIKSFFRLVEIQTKVASVFPFLIAVLYTLYRYGQFKILEISLFFISMIAIDLATTALNNYMDYHKAILKSGYNYEQHNAMTLENLSDNMVKLIISALLIIGIVAGLFLVSITDMVIMIIGIIAFGVGIMYSYGPIPISRTPFGEMLSGLLMGGGIFFACIYMQIYDMGIVIVYFKSGFVTVGVDLKELLFIVIVSIPMVFGVANIMLANNICDVEEDVVNKRYTLPHYIGKKTSIKLFHILTYIPLLFIIIAVVIDILPITSLITLLAIIPMIKGSRVFHEQQNKRTTFIIAVKHFLLLNGTYAITIFMGLVIKWVIV